MLLDGRDMLMEDVDVVKDVVKNHFEQNFAEPQYNRPTLGGISFKNISGDDNDWLTQPFEEDEIKERVQSCDGDKSLSRMILVYGLSSNIGMS